jgi:hypothetical protein
MLVIISVGMVSVLAKAKEQAKPSQMIRAILTCDQKVWDGKEPLNFHFSVRNDTKKPVRLNGRMPWPGNLYLNVRLPSNGEIGVKNLIVKALPPTNKDIVTLQPGKMYSKKLILDPKNEDISKELRKPSPGRYTFYANYTSTYRAQFRLDDLRLTSNSVTVEVKQTKRR